MGLVALAWMYVVLMMAAAEATSPNGTVLGAVLMVFGYGLLPLGIVLYLLRAPTRRAQRLAAEAELQAAAQAACPAEVEASAQRVDPDRGGHAPGDPVATKREES